MWEHRCLFILLQALYHRHLNIRGQTHAIFEPLVVFILEFSALKLLLLSHLPPIFFKCLFWITFSGNYSKAWLRSITNIFWTPILLLFHGGFIIQLPLNELFQFELFEHFKVIGGLGLISLLLSRTVGSRVQEAQVLQYFLGVGEDEAVVIVLVFWSWWSWRNGTLFGLSFCLQRIFLYFWLSFEFIQSFIFDSLYLIHIDFHSRQLQLLLRQAILVLIPDPVELLLRRLQLLHQHFLFGSPSALIWRPLLFVGNCGW